MRYLFTMVFIATLYFYALCQLVSVSLSGLDSGILYGQSHSLFNNEAIIAAPREEIAGMTFTGAVYVHTRDDFGWEHIQKIIASDGNEYDEFGFAIDQNSRFAAISSPSKGTGAVYVFNKESHGNWQEVQKISIPEGYISESPHAQFGYSVSMADSFLIISAPGFRDITNTSGGVGAVFAYRQNGNAFQFLQCIPAPDVEFAHFGASVVMDKKEMTVPVLLITAPVGDGGAYKSGVVFLFEFVDNKWQISYTLINPFSRSHEFFGTSADIYGDNVIIGIGMYTSDETQGPKGSAHIFQKSGNTWLRTGILEAPDGARNDIFGHAVQIEENLVLVGAPRHSHSGYINPGKVYAFTLQNGNWLHKESFVAPHSETQDHMQLGAKIDLHNGHALISAHLMNNMQNNSGNTYHMDFSLLVNTREMPAKKQQEILIVPNPAYDQISIHPGKEFVFPLDIAVYDLQGKIIFTQKETYSNNLNISAILPGTYFVFIRSKEVHGTAKFIKFK